MSTIYALEIIRPIFNIVLIVFGLLAAAILYLAFSQSAWWLVGDVVIAGWILVILIVRALVLGIAKVTAPTMTPQQSQAAQAYVRTLHDVQGTLQTPKFIIAYKVIVDICKRRWQGGYIQQTTVKSARLKNDFEAIIRSYE